MSACEHGQLARSCNICEFEAEITSLSAQLATVTAENERLRKDLGAIRSGVPTQVMSAATDAIATARSEGWRACRDAAVRVARSTGRYSKADAEVCDEIAEAIAALEPSSLTETKGKEP